MIVPDVVMQTSPVPVLTVPEEATGNQTVSSTRRRQTARSDTQQPLLGPLTRFRRRITRLIFNGANKRCDLAFSLSSDKAH